MQESSRDQQQAYCEDNESVRVEMPKQGSTIEFKDGQNQFKVPFVIYADFELILEPMDHGSSDPSQPYTNEVNQHTPSGWCVYSKFAYGDVDNPLRLYGVLIASKLFVITSKKKFIDCITCFLKNQWIL